MTNKKPPEMVAAAVHGFLFYAGLELFEDQARDVETHWGLNYDEAYSYCIRSCPTWHENLIASQAAAKEFGADSLGHVDGFYSFNRSRAICNCSEWRADCVCADPCWALDIDPHLARRGLLLGIHDHHGWITRVKVFRHAADQHPFWLRVRREVAA